MNWSTNNVLTVAWVVMGAIGGVIAQVPPLQLNPPSGTECLTEMTYPALARMKADPAAAGFKFPPSADRRIFLRVEGDASQITEYSDGTSTAEFLLGKFYLRWNSKHGAQIFPVGSEDDPGVPDFRKNPLPELDWVDPSDFVEEREVEGRKVLVFEEGSDGPATGRRTLLVDPATGFPISLETFNEKFTYEFKPLSEGDAGIVLPTGLAAAWDQVRRDYRRYYKKEITD